MYFLWSALVLPSSQCSCCSGFRVTLWNWCGLLRSLSTISFDFHGLLIGPSARSLNLWRCISLNARLFSHSESYKLVWPSLHKTFTWKYSNENKRNNKRVYSLSAIITWMNKWLVNRSSFLSNTAGWHLRVCHFSIALFPNVIVPYAKTFHTDYESVWSYLKNHIYTLEAFLYITVEKTSRPLQSHYY